MRKQTICIGENKGAEQLRGSRKADQGLCFRFSERTIPLHFKAEVSIFQLSSVTVQSGLCRPWSETTLLVFPLGGSLIQDIIPYNFFVLIHDVVSVFCNDDK